MRVSTKRKLCSLNMGISFALTAVTEFQLVSPLSLMLKYVMNVTRTITEFWDQPQRKTRLRLLSLPNEMT